MLGHDVPFSYCRAPGRQLPCSRIFDCWWQTFDVEGFIRSHFSEAEIRQITAPRSEKIPTIVELIERARRAGKQEP